MKKLLVIRFSALGDVAMSIPLVLAIARQYPDIEITFLSKKNCAPLFASMPENVKFLGADFKGEHKGHFGWQRLMHELNIRQFDAVADLHGLFRSRRIALNAWLRGKKIATINKGKRERKQLTREKDKIFAPIRPVIERYQSVFQKLGYDIPLDFPNPIYSRQTQAEGIEIGIAPFAQHQGKIYPLEKMEKVVELLSLQPNTQILLFGAGEKEMAVINDWCSRYPHTQSAKQLGGMAGELKRMAQLNVMLSMDSANMHFAALTHTPTISIWGATHPYCGFLGWQAKDSVVLQAELPCRPCSAYGNKPCLRGDYACLHAIAPEHVVETINQLIQQQKS